jgi:thiol:disulfide interchange protein/DsbC/DsbD-like thiol-disulfide interchange protein
MRVIAAVAGCLAVLVGAAAAVAQIGDQRPLVKAALVAENAAAKRGETLTVALRQTIAPGWHTYWQNPGDSGEPTTIEWTLPAGMSAGAIQWPLPSAIPVGPLVNYGYSDQLLLLSDIKIPQDFAGDALKLSANVRWLVCKDICVPEEATVSLNLPLIDPALSPRPSADAGAIKAVRASLPQAANWPMRYESTDKTLTLKIDSLGGDAAGLKVARFYPVNWGQIANAAPQKASFTGGGLTLRMERGDTGLEAGKPLEGLLALEDASGRRRGYVISAAGGPAPASAVGTVQLGETAATDVGLGVALLFAFLGGLVLNLMPCVFPVLSLKAYGLAREASDPRSRHMGGFAYLAGVLASFGLLAAGLLALRSIGLGAGWGIQFQSPVFVLVLIGLFLALGLNMSGVFEVGGSLAGAGDDLARKEGLAGSFFTGVLATVVATPCTAPFMGAAVGYAFAQPPVQATAVLMMLGLGFAFPILLLSLTPALGRLLPKPGMWMVRFKQVMAFPLYATAAWLVWVLSVQQGSDGVMAAMVVLLAVGFAGWLIGLPSRIRWLGAAAAWVIGVAGIVGGLAILDATRGADNHVRADVSGTASGPRAEAYTQAKLDSLVAEGKPVFINLTAAWCITCKVNERVALNSKRIADAFTDRGVVYLKGDWTSPNPEISSLLQSFGRAGVPLYLLYSGKAGVPPKVLPQFLTETIIIDHLAELTPPVKQAKGDM